MNAKYNYQSQFELFPGAVREQTQNSTPRFFLRNLNLSLENLVVACIIMMIGLILAFSLGVERGKRIMRTDMAAAASKMDQTLETAMGEEAVSPSAAMPIARAALPGSAKQGKNAGAISLSPRNESAVQGEVLADVNSETSLSLPATGEAALEKNVDKLLNKGYTIQVASFKKDEFAQREVEALKKKAFDAVVISKGSHLIVCVGQFDKKDEAKAFSRKLKGLYKDLVIRSL